MNMKKISLYVFVCIIFSSFIYASTYPINLLVVKKNATTNNVNNTFINASGMNESYNYGYNQTEWVGFRTTGEGILQVEVSAVQDDSTSHWNKIGSDLYYSAGNVGVGLNNPDSNLDISGTLELNGAVISSWSEVNYTVNAGNSNDTLVQMFMNISNMSFMNVSGFDNGTFEYKHKVPNNVTIWEAVNSNVTVMILATNNSIMNNQTIYNMILSNITVIVKAINNSLPNNATIWEAVRPNVTVMDLAINRSRMNNETIQHLINGTRLNDTWFYPIFANLTNIMNNQTIANAIDNESIIRTYNTSWIADNLTSGDGIVIQGNEIFATSTNGSNANMTYIRYLGSALSGNSGETYRNLTHANTQMVSLDNGFLHPIDDYNSTHTNITFFNPVWDDQIINVWSLANTDLNMTYVNYLGSDCDGSSGDANRNLATSGANMVVIDNSWLSYTDDYTLSGGTVTFLNPLWDDQRITVWRLE